MSPRFNQLKDMSKFFKFDVLPSLERVLGEKWNDDLLKMLDASHSIDHLLAMVLANHAAAEMGFQSVKHLHVALVLHDAEFRYHLESNRRCRVGFDPHVEAAFAINESHDPLCVKLHWNTLEREVSEESRIC